MARCELCGNDYDKSFELIRGGERQTRKSAKSSSTKRGSKRVAHQAAGARHSERPKEPKVSSNRPGAVRFPGADEDTDRSHDGREEQSYRDEVMHTRERR